MNNCLIVVIWVVIVGFLYVVFRKNDIFIWVGGVYCCYGWWIVVIMVECGIVYVVGFIYFGKGVELFDSLLLVVEVVI